MNVAGRSAFWILQEHFYNKYKSTDQHCWKLYWFYVQFSVGSFSLMHSPNQSMTVIIYHVQARSAKLRLIIKRDSSMLVCIIYYWLNLEMPYGTVQTRKLGKQNFKIVAAITKSLRSHLRQIVTITKTKNIWLFDIIAAFVLRKLKHELNNVAYQVGGLTSGLGFWDLRHKF